LSGATGYFRCVGLLGDAQLPDARDVTEQIVCPECGSGSLVASGVYEHGTWVYRLTCWTCRDCQTVVAFPEGEATALGGTEES
jgi:ribosomal protein S27AE